MSEASPDLHPPPVLPAAPPRRAKGVLRRGRVDGRRPAAGAPFVVDEPSHPLDPPLVDVRIPVKEPHAAATAYSRMSLRHRFPQAQVGDDLHMLFSEPGKPKRSRLSPDVLVALDVPRRDTRADYDADVLGPPDFILEVLSRSTWKHDVGRKLDCYQRLGVCECLLFNATGEDLPGADKELWGFSLAPGSRERLREVVLPNGARGVYSAVLGLVAYVADRTPPSGTRETWALTMRWHDPATAADIPDYEQSRAGEARARAEARAQRAKAQEERVKAQRERAKAQAERAKAQAERVKAQEERAKAEAERVKAQEERAKAQAANARAEAERSRAEAERARAEANQRRIAELEEQLRRPRDGP